MRVDELAVRCHDDQLILQVRVHSDAMSPDDIEPTVWRRK